MSPLLRGDTDEAISQFLRVLDAVRRRVVPKWTPFERASEYTDGSGAPQSYTESEPQVWVNSRYQVVLNQGSNSAVGRFTHLSIKTLENDAHHDWREFQRIKNELVGPEYEAVEIYPAESRLVDTANQYHLYVFLDTKIPLGFGSRLIAEETEGLSRQRRWEDGQRPKDCRTITPEEMAAAKNLMT